MGEIDSSLAKHLREVASLTHEQASRFDICNGKMLLLGVFVLFPFLKEKIHENPWPPFKVKYNKSFTIWHEWGKRECQLSNHSVYRNNWDMCRSWHPSLCPLDEHGTSPLSHVLPRLCRAWWGGCGGSIPSSLKAQLRLALLQPLALVRGWENSG